MHKGGVDAQGMRKDAQEMHNHLFASWPLWQSRLQIQANVSVILGTRHEHVHSDMVGANLVVFPRIP